MWVLHAFFLGMTHATKKIMDINATITCRVCQKLSVQKSEGSASSCSCFHHVKSNQRWSKNNHRQSLRVCPQRILRESSEPQQKGERCESQVDFEVKVGKSNASVNT